MTGDDVWIDVDFSVLAINDNMKEAPVPEEIAPEPEQQAGPPPQPLQELYDASSGAERAQLRSDPEWWARLKAEAGRVDIWHRARWEGRTPEEIAPQPDVVLAQFPLLDLAGLLDPNRPARRWLWDGLVPEGDHVSIVAAGGTGKSLMVLALAVESLRGGTEFAGRAITAPKRVLYVDMENSEDDWAERLDDLGVTTTEAASWAGRFMPLSFPRLAGLDTAEGAQQLVQVIEAYGVGAGDLLVLDSTQRVTEGDENSNDTIRRLYNLTSAELKRRGITVIRTDNTGHDGDRARGASAKRDDVAMSWVLERIQTTTDTFTLKPVKRRASGSSEGLTFRQDTSGPEGRLRYIQAAGPAFSTILDNVRAALNQAGVGPEVGQQAAWDAVQAMGAPDGVTRALVRKVQGERRLAHGAVIVP